jgi:hypothetical protein
MLRFFGLAMMAALLSLAWAASPATGKKSCAKKSTGKTASAKQASGSKKSTAKRTTWRNRQLAPTPARYREIQEALAAKGYLKPEEATGSWSQSSVDALKNFQADQKLESNGKINSLSLIALGLGPKREAVVKPPAPPAADQ